MSEKELDVKTIVASLQSMHDRADWPNLEKRSRELNSIKRFFVWHQFLIVALLEQGRLEEAENEFDGLMSYKFNLSTRMFPRVKAQFGHKLNGHYIVNLTSDKTSFEGHNLGTAHWPVFNELRNRMEFFRVANDIVRKTVSRAPFLPRQGTRICTFGSCFAAHLAKEMRSRGIDATTLIVEETINSPLANYELLSLLVDGTQGHGATMLAKIFGEATLDLLRHSLKAADVIITTVGVAPSFFERDTGRAAFLPDYRAQLAAGTIVMRTPRVAEIKAQLSGVYEKLRVLAPTARLYLTVSPVPLSGTTEFSNAVFADCVSKTTLRAAVHEFLDENNGTHDAKRSPINYWPSFEIVKWLGLHNSERVYGGEGIDQRHVADWVVEWIVDAFCAHLFGTALDETAMHSAPPSPCS